MATQVFASFSGGAINAHIAEELLVIAKKAVVFQQIGTKAVMPSGEGKTFQFNRYERLNLPQSVLTEGVAPTSTNMSLSTVSAVADQWGAFVQISDVAMLTIKHPLLNVAMDLLGYQAAELVDREIIKILLASTNVSYGGAITTRQTLATVATDSLSDAVAQRVLTHLRTQGAHPYEGTHYVGVVDPGMEQDISQTSNTAFTQASAYSNVKQLFNGEIGTWRGVRWMSSNLIPKLVGLAAGTYSSPASPAGTFTSANYRVTTQYISNATGLVEKYTDDANVASTNLDSLAGTTPSDTSYTYKIFVGLAAGAASAVMYQGSDTTQAFGAIAASTAFSVLAPPVAGTVADAIPGSGKTVHFGWVFGKQAFASVDLMNLKAYVSDGKAIIGDPLAQNRTVGYKLMFKPVIQNQNFLERIEVLSAFE